MKEAELLGPAICLQQCKRNPFDFTTVSLCTSHFLRPHEFNERKDIKRREREATMTKMRKKYLSSVWDTGVRWSGYRKRWLHSYS